MEIKKLRVINFRNFADFSCEFGSGLTLLLGPNGAGKTNLLEAIYFLATGSSPRTVRDHEAIRWGEHLARIEAEIGSTKLAVVLRRSGKKLFLNSKERNLRDFLVRFQVVLFQPSDLNLLVGRPSGRRQFLNRLVGLYDYEYLQILSEYNRVLRQRNQLLARMGTGGDELAIWTEELVRLAAILQSKRGRAIAKLNKALVGQDLSLQYLVSPRRGSLAERLVQLRSKERQIGFTLIGPQRDDFLLLHAVARKGKIQQVDLGTYGSRGEQRMAISKLKLAQLQIIEGETGQKPLLLLDDIFSELDNRHLVEMINLLKAQPVLLSVADDLESQLVQRLLQDGANVIKLGKAYQPPL